VPTYDRDGGLDSTTRLSLGGGQVVLDVNFGFASVPTAVTLASFIAERQADGSVAVRWVTGAEVGTWGFHVLRSADGQRDHAVRVTASLLAHQGSAATGAAYSWVDTQAEPGVTYTYWLEEVELGGATNVYGPATAAAAAGGDSYTLFLPSVTR
jgi:hypothetical protein